MRTTTFFIAVFTAGAAFLAAPQRSTDSASAGEAVFFGKGNCSSCHEINGRGGIVGPDLSAAGTRSSEALRAKILNPNAPTGGRGGGSPLVVIARRPDGREIQGVRRNEDTFSLQLMDSSGQLHLLDKTKLVEVRRENRSLMPQDYATRLTDADLQSLVDYLSTLKARDLTKTAVANISGGVSYERLRNSRAEPQNWLHYWGDYQGTHYSGLKEVTAANASRLQARWSTTISATGTLETQPLVVDGIMYATAAGTVVALDARTGRQIWNYTRQQKVRNPNDMFGTTLPRLPSTLPKRTAENGSRCFVAHEKDRELGDALARAHRARVDGLVGRDVHEPASVVGGDLRERPRAEHVGRTASDGCDSRIGTCLCAAAWNTTSGSYRSKISRRRFSSRMSARIGSALSSDDTASKGGCRRGRAEGGAPGGTARSGGRSRCRWIRPHR